MSGRKFKVTRIPEFESKYAQCFYVGFTPMEFGIELGNTDPDTTIPHLHTGIIMSPQRFREFLDTCEKAWTNYEKHIGELDKAKSKRSDLR